MQDDQLLQNLKALPYPVQDVIEQLEQHRITTCSQLFTLLRDTQASPELQRSACWALSSLREQVDKRRAVPPLLVALDSADPGLQSAAADALGMLRSRRAVKPMLALVANREQDEWHRFDLVNWLCMIPDQRVIDFLRPLMFDRTENVLVRSGVIEWLYDPDKKRSLEDAAALLADPVSDIRFWAAFRLAGATGDLRLVLPELDRIAAFDHTLPEYWGWHVDREAICALEKAYLQPVTNDDSTSLPVPWLISPAAEYSTFVQQYRNGTEAAVPPVTLSVDPAWLADKLRSTWPDVQLNTREPRPQAYLLDWRLTLDNHTLNGALHRDRYAVVLTGQQEAVKLFAAWYRSIIAAEQPLFLYEWADESQEL